MFGGVIALIVIVALVFVIVVGFFTIINAIDISDGGVASLTHDKEYLPGNHDIDLVITWAGPNNDEARMKQREDYTGDRKEQDPNRYQDNGELFIGIRHAIGLGWVRRIHVVYPSICTLPSEGDMIEVAGRDWGDRIFFVSDSVILPPEALPSFSSHPVEANLHRIPQLTERFVYTCDDAWIVGDVAENKLFSDIGPTPMYSRDLVQRSTNQHDKACTNTLTVLKRAFGDRSHPYRYHHHHAVPLTKKGYARTWELFANELTDTTRRRFRSDDDIHPTNLVINTMCVEKMATWTKSENAVFMSTINSIPSNRFARNMLIVTGKLRSNKTDFLCVNDDVTKGNEHTRQWFRNNFDQRQYM